MMKKKRKGTLKPRLRFPEFKEEWRPATIGQVFNPDDKPVKAARFESDKILTVRLHANGVVRNERTGTLTGGSNYFVRRAGQFIFSKIDLLNGAFGIVPKEFDGFCSSSDVPAFSFGTQHSPAFFLNWLTARYRRLDIERTGTSATLKRVAPEKLWELPIPLPSPAEQQKIAECLSSLDALIAAEGRKLEALKAHKKGLMQQLFPRPGESRPRLRFPEFRGEGEWEEVTLDTCFPHIRNGFVGTATPFYVDKGVPYLQGKNVKKGRIDPSGLVTISQVFHDKQKNSQLRLEDIVMVQSGHVGECALIDGSYAGANCHALIIMTPERGQHSSFFVHCFGSDYGTKLISQITTGNTIKHILASDVKALVVHIPPLAEQKHIADCLTALDTQIAAQAAKIESLTQHKRGLMQQLFPAPEGS